MQCSKEVNSSGQLLVEHLCHVSTVDQEHSAGQVLAQFACMHLHMSLQVESQRQQQ